MPKLLIVILFICSFITGCADIDKKSNNPTNLSYNNPTNNNTNVSTTVNNPALHEYVNRIGKKITLVSNDPNLRIQFSLSDSKTPQIKQKSNRLYISTSLISLLEDEAELAAIIAHELAHKNQKHNASTFFSTYTAYEEIAADKLAMKYISRAGYDPKALIDLQTRFKSYTDNDSNLTKGYIARHALSEQRLTSATKSLKKLPKNFNRNKEIFAKHTNTIKRYNAEPFLRSFNPTGENS
jgi:beta-barrel assembly-enhancing protease